MSIAALTTVTVADSKMSCAIFKQLTQQTELFKMFVMMSIFGLFIILCGHIAILPFSKYQNKGISTLSG